MDEVRQFFNNPCSSKSQVKKLRAPLTDGFYISKENHINELNRRVEHRRAVVPSGTDYAREVRDRENDLYVQHDEERKRYESMSGGMESIDKLTSIGASLLNFSELTQEAMEEVYSKYTLHRKEDTNNLAINEFKQDILDAIRAFSVVIIEGPTGCGKTTQVPQWILDDCYQNHRPCKIIVTQPRRIAAISVSRRVAQERGWDVGGLVGYQVGLDNKTSGDSRIMYVTTGILLQKLVASKTMNEYSHIILDEVHERGQEMDFLLLVVKKLLFTVSPNVKVTLMSATFNSKQFAEYFSIPNPHGLPNSACIKVEKNEPMFTVKKFYLNHLNKFGSILEQCRSAKEDPGIAPEMYHLVVKLVNAFELIDKHEDDYTDRNEADLPSVLIFLPGINEIEDLFNALNDLTLRTKLCDAACAQYNWWVLPLHSTITADEQVRVFQRAPPGHRKIILSTNIAESSITVPDIKYVIDFCLMKTLVADEHTNFTSLQLTWASKTNCDQRAGRAGRVRDGRVYRLVTDKFYETLKQESMPEIIRCPLERLVLLAKMLDMGPPSDILALAMDPPDMSNIRRTILVLKEMGALKKTVDDVWSNSDGDITYLGRIMAKLPLDVKVSKMIMLGYIFGVLDQAVIMAAAMSVKNVFSSPFRERLNAYNSKLTWADGSTSDCIAFYNVYQVWRHLRQQNHFKQPGNNEAQWARRFYVQARALREMDDLVKELKNRLSREDIDATKAPSPWNRFDESLALKVVIAGAFYPQYFIQVSTCEDRERDAVKTLGGLDPRDTVYLKDFPSKQPGEVYATAIKNAVKQIIHDEPTVTFDKNSQKVYLTFGDNIGNNRRGAATGDPTIPGQVLLPVYKSIKARQLKMEVRIQLLPEEKAHELATALEASKLALSDLETLVPRLPDVDESHFPLRICQLITVSKFWVQQDDESTRSELDHIHKTLNTGQLIAHTGPVRPGDMMAAPHNEGVGRVRIMKLLPRDMVQVLYVDWGIIGQVNACNLRVLPAGICTSTPPLAMRCRLSGIAPAPLMGRNGHCWSDSAQRRFTDMCSRSSLFAKVYSVVHGVVAIELLADEGQTNVNQELLRAGYAVPCDESYESKMNHDLRQTANELNNAQKRACNREQTEAAYDQLREIDPPSAKECCSAVVLKGAYSPLETSVHTLMYGSREKTVNIEWSSVNSVLLDTDPQQMHEKLLVAATVGQNEHSHNLTLRHTTMLPNIPGLPAIMALLFCPTAEFRRDSQQNRYVSALCGLGSDDDGVPYFPEHDLLLNIDAELENEDVCAINHIRHLMDFMMYCNEGQDSPADDENRPKVPATIKEGLKTLLKKRRKYREPQAVSNAWEWKSVPDEDVLEIINPEMVERTVVYPLHSPQELKPVSLDHLRALKNENDNLKSLVGRTPISSSVQHICKLCGTLPMPTHQMRIHLYSNAHMEKEDDLAVVRS